MPPNLVKTQRWLQNVIIHTGTTEQAIADQKTRNPVTPSHTLTAEQRVEIYREAYFLRLREALGIDYPGVKRYLGDQAFDKLCDAYCTAHPSQSNSLNRLGDHFPAFIAKKRKPFLADLARLELMMTEVFDAEELSALTPEQVAQIPAEKWDAARLQPVAALRHGKFRFPVSQYLRTKRKAYTQPKESYIIVSRRDYALRNLELTAPAYKLFTALAAGKPLAKALAGINARPKQIQTWFQTWIAHGLFHKILL